MTAEVNWAEHVLRLGEQVAGLLGSTETPSTDPASCRWCPLCQLIAMLRGERPGAAEALADVLATTAGALRMLAGEQAAPAGTDAEADHEPGAAAWPAAAPGSAAAAPEPVAAQEPVPVPVQRIQIA